MTYADKYTGMLRIVHGTSDDNVHMQNSIQLISKLQELRKHFEFMVYPGERHGIGGNSANKAAHNRNEQYKFYYEQLLNKPMPDVFWGTTQQRAF
jgi:dipeptidyl-peptidase-4